MTEQQRTKRREAYRRFLERNPDYNKFYLREWRRRNRELMEARPRRAKVNNQGIEYGPLPYTIHHEPSKAKA